MRRTALAGIAVGLLIGAESLAQEANQPYIDREKKRLQAEFPDEPPAGTYIERKRRELGDEPASRESYTERVKRRLQEEDSEDRPSESFIQKRRRELSPRESRSAIAETLAGRSELKADKGGPPSFATGFRVTASRQANITAGGKAQGHPFAEIYDVDGWVPDVSLFGEWQPFHSEWFGSAGLVAGLGFSLYSGTGIFDMELPIPSQPGEFFSTRSRTQFRFYTVPVSVGLNYRFNLLRFIRPYVHALPTVIGFLESRSDEQADQRGFSVGAVFGGGVAIPLDFFSRAMSWDIYAASGIKRTMLTIEYNKMITFTGDVRFDVSGISAGFTFEY